MINVLIYAAYGAATVVLAVIALAGARRWGIPPADDRPDLEELVAVTSGHYDLEESDDDTR